MESRNTTIRRNCREAGGQDFGDLRRNTAAQESGWMPRWIQVAG